MLELVDDWRASMMSYFRVEDRMTFLGCLGERCSIRVGTVFDLGHSLRDPDHMVPSRPSRAPMERFRHSPAPL